MDKHLAVDVFTPSSAASLTFVERRQINERVVRALQTPGMQLVVYGRTGCGKTTLLVNKLQQLYDHHITSRCEVGTTLEQLLLDAFDQLAPVFVETLERSQKNSILAALEAPFQGIKVTLQGARELSERAVEKRVLPPQLTPHFLARALGAINACWILEDFHKVDEAHKKRLSQIMKLFMDAAAEHRTVRIVAIGAVATARQVVDYDPEMANRVAQIEVPLMSADELTEIMQKGEDLLNVRIAPALRENIIYCSNGLPAICHQLCLNMCQVANVVETQINPVVFTSDQLQRALREWLEYSKDSLQGEYDRAVRAERIKKFDNCRIVVNALGALPPDGGTHHDILSEINKEVPEYRASNLTHYLRKLESAACGNIISRDAASNRYFFTSPMMHAYVRTLSRKSQKASLKDPHRFTIDLSEFYKTIVNENFTYNIDVGKLSVPVTTRTFGNQDTAIKAFQLPTTNVKSDGET